MSSTSASPTSTFHATFGRFVPRLRPRAAAPQPEAARIPVPAMRQLYDDALTGARAAFSRNPAGVVDNFLFQPSTWRSRQGDMLARGAQHRAAACDSVLLGLDIASPGIYVLNKVFGNGRLQPNRASTTDGPLADGTPGASIGGLIPWLAEKGMQGTAWVGAALGCVAGAAFGARAASAVALNVTRVGALIASVGTQVSVGMNVVFKALLINQTLGLILPAAAFNLLVYATLLRLVRNAAAAEAAHADEHRAAGTPEETQTADPADPADGAAAPSGTPSMATVPAGEAAAGPPQPSDATTEEPSVSRTATSSLEQTAAASEVGQQAAQPTPDPSNFTARQVSDLLQEQYRSAGMYTPVNQS